MCRPDADSSEISRLQKESIKTLKHAKERSKRVAQDAKERARLHWQHAIEEVRAILHAPAHYRGPLNIAAQEHMEGVDCLNGELMRAGQKEVEASEKEEEDLLVITPIADGRLKDVGRS